MKASVCQRSLAASISLEGIGVHSGLTCAVTIDPADADTGIVFEINGTRIPATLQSALGHQHHRQTILGDPRGSHVATPEHVLSALRGMGIDNARIRVTAPELPLLDGGAAQFADAIAATGFVDQDRPRRILNVSRPVAFKPGAGAARFSAHPFDGLTLTYFVDYSDRGDNVVGRIGASIVVTPEAYQREIAPARTFAFESEIERLRRAGMGLGGSLDTVVVIGASGYLNDRLNFPDEIVRHKILDLIGDLSLAGCALRGHIMAECTGHGDNVQFAQFLKEQFE